MVEISKGITSFLCPSKPHSLWLLTQEPRIRVWLLPCPKTMRLVSALSERRYFKMSHPVLHLSWNPGRVASLPLPKPFFLLPQRLSLSFYPSPLLASSPSSLGGHTSAGRSQRHPCLQLLSEAQTPERAGGGAEWAKALPPRFGRGQRPRRRRWLVGAGPAAGVGARRFGPGRERSARRWGREARRGTRWSVAQLWRHFPLATRRAWVPEGKYGQGALRHVGQVEASRGCAPEAGVVWPDGPRCHFRAE